MGKKRVIAAALAAAVGVMSCTGCGTTDQKDEDAQQSQEESGIYEESGEGNMMNNAEQKDVSVIRVTEANEHQTWQGFGASAAWWAQYVGGWDEPYGDSDVAVREQIAQYLFSRDEGIGLTIYRYNVGAGSRDSYLGDISDQNRRAQSFIGVDGEYDWDKDANAVWMMKRAVELGVQDVVFFCNSPLESLTANGLAHMSEGSTSNLPEENYDDFAKYVCDVTEHFIEEGIPVTDISPINEPQWDWLNGQEGCHYETEELVAVLKVFVEEVQSREGLSDVVISSPESGEWGGKTREYVNAILSDDVLGAYFQRIDCHSYWTDTATKEKFKEWMDSHFPEVSLVTSEWCEMVNGKDYTMDSAFNMADVIYDDLTILDVVSWQLWVAVADGDYRDGLIYVNKDQKACRAAKRLWGYGNYTRYIRPGYVRVDIDTETEEDSQLKPVAFKGTDDDGTQQLVMLFLNREEAEQISIAVTEEYAEYHVYTTNEERDLEKTAGGSIAADTVFELEAASIVTVVLEK